MRLWLFLLCFAPMIASGQFGRHARAADAAPKKVVLVAGRKSHGPVGNGIHDYPWSVKLLKVMLDNSNVRDRVRVEYHLDGWPVDPKALDDADTIMIVSDGRDGDLYEEAPHFQNEEQTAAIARQMRRGCGFLTFHFSTFAPDEHAEQILEWSGGYFDWETDGRREWYSAIQTLDTEVRPATPEHPICRGIEPFRMNEEFYFNIRFRPDDANLKPILTVPALPGREPDGRVVAWAREREDGGRGFGTTCGHFYENWKNDAFRRTILNAIVWTAGAEVPPGGVEARFYTHEEITAALDGVEGTERAVVADTRPIRALILTGAQHPAHKWQDTTPALRDVLERDPRMHVDVSDRVEDLGTPKIREYDLLVVNYCNWQQPGLSDAAKTGFVEYLAGGGGLCLIHFANGAFHFSLPGAEESDWPEYRKICRRVWDHTPGKSGHDAHGKFVVEITRNAHPITEGLEAFETTDELYFRQQGNEPIEVLAEARSKVTGAFEPMAFVYEYRKARVFQTVLGHDADAIRTTGTAALIRRAAAWVARREPMPDSELKAAKIPGHWGEDAIGFRWTEEDSVDNRWNRTDVGAFQASIVPLPDQRPVAKGLSIRVGEDQEASVCFDTQRCALRAAWTGFLSFDLARYGLIEPPRIAGALMFSAGERAGWDAADVQYRGLHLHGDRVVLGYEVAGTTVFDAPWLESRGELQAFTRTIEVGSADAPLTMRLLETPVSPEIGLAEGVPLTRFENGGRMTAVAVSGHANVQLQVEQNAILLVVPPAGETRRFKILCWSGVAAELGEFAALARTSVPPEPLDGLREPGPPRWTEAITTRGILGSGDGPYTVDTLTLPFDNPYGALLFVGGHDFLSNGDIALCTVHGDVWLVSGVDESLEKLTWKRFATGLFQPLGLKVVDDRIHVLGRDQITRLHDRNGDGEADYYECFSNAHVTSPGGHDYVACLETDPQGNFYFVHATQGMVRVSRDGRNLETIATGLRNPNGMGVGPDGTITVAPQEGEWTPASCVIQVRSGGHYGYRGPQVAPDRPLGYDPPLCYIPRLQDNSSGGQVWVTSDRWGPLTGQLLHLSYGKCRIMLVLREEAGGQMQGGVVDLPLDFASGVMRGRFSAHDGQLYVSGLRGWTSAAAQDGCLQRVRYTGRPVDFPIAARTMQNGLAITFTRPLDPESTQRPDNYHVQQWNYRYSEGYGSAEYRVSDPQQEGRDDVPVRSATLLDERTVFLEIDELQPVMQMTVGYALAASDGTPIEQTIAYTIHRVGPDSVDSSRLVRREVPGRLAADLQARLRPGLIARFEQNGRRDARISRLAALHVPAGTPPASFLAPGAFMARFEGWVRAPLRGRYTFHVEGNGAPDLRINGAEVLEGEIGQTASSPVALHQGYNRLELDYASAQSGDPSLRLVWSSESFPIEPVPPTALFCDGADAELLGGEQLRRGRQLAGTHRCFGCHAVPANAAPVALQLTAPDLEDTGERLERNWLFQWLLDPRHLRNDATMPRLFEENDPAARRDAADLTAWLTSASTNTAAERPSGGLAARGEALYAELGCIGCHRMTPANEPDEHDRVSLFYVDAKYRPGALRAFLRAPHAHHTWSRMPDFQLSETEARALAAWLRTAGGGTISAADDLDRADPKRGERLFRERLCATCHTVGDQHPPQRPALPGILGAPEPTGCLAEKPDRRGRAPELGLSDTDRAALVALLGTDGASLARSVPAETSAQLVETLRCSACHNRDGRTSPRQLLTIEETGTGLLPEALPDLTWAGEKLNARWTEQLLKGELSYRPRPWLKARMPAFPAYAEQLSAGLPAEHGVDPREQQPLTIDQRLADLGHRLSLKDTLDCRQCHGIGCEEPLGDERTQLAPGINFSHVRERLRYDHYRRLVLDPPRYDVGTKMPKLSTDGRTTKVTHILDGNARRQFEALWHYIQSSPAPLSEPAAGE